MLGTYRREEGRRGGEGCVRWLAGWLDGWIATRCSRVPAIATTILASVHACTRLPLFSATPLTTPGSRARRADGGGAVGASESVSRSSVRCGCFASPRLGSRKLLTGRRGSACLDVANTQRKNKSRISSPRIPIPKSSCTYPPSLLSSPRSPASPLQSNQTQSPILKPTYE
jgi:hypothetical protein